MIADRATLAQQQAEQKAQRLAERLRALGYDPEEFKVIAAQEHQQKEKFANYLRAIGVDPDAMRSRPQGELEKQIKSNQGKTYHFNLTVA